MPNEPIDNPCDPPPTPKVVRRPHDDLSPPLTAGERDLVKLLRSGVLQSVEWGGYTIRRKGRSR